MNDLPPGAIAVSTEEMLMLLGRLYLENYVLQRRLALATQQLLATRQPEETPPVPPTEP